MDAAALSSLYSNEAFFFGSNPNLYHGREGVAAYFNGLPRWRWRAPLLAFSDVACAYVTPEVVKMPPSYRFDLGEEGPPLSVKIGYGEDGDLKIANHHVSSRVPLI